MASSPYGDHEMTIKRDSSSPEGCGFYRLDTAQTSNINLHQELTNVENRQQMLKTSEILSQHSLTPQVTKETFTDKIDVQERGTGTSEIFQNNRFFLEIGMFCLFIPCFVLYF